MTTAKTDLLTADDLLRLYSEGVRGELVRGVLRETMPSGQRHGAIVAKLLITLGMFIEPRRLGTLVASDSGILLERDPDTVREPDIAFTSISRLPPDAVRDGYAEVVPDLVLEIVPPNDRPRDIAAKAAMWLSHGVRLVWVVHPADRAIDIHRPDAAIETLREDATLNSGDVLPGFTCLVSAVFDS